MNIRKIQQDDKPKTERPIIVTICCLIGFGGAIFSLLLMSDYKDTFSIVSQQLGMPLFAELIISTVVGLCCFIGFWNMRKWSVYTYSIFFILFQGQMLLTGRWNAFSLIIPGAIILVMWIYIKRMR